MLKIIRRVYDFGDFSRTRPNEPVPGDMLDAQFDEIINQIDTWDARVRRAINDEGKVAAGTVNMAALDDDFRVFMQEHLQNSAKDIAFRLSEYAKSAIAAEKRALEAEKTAIAAAAQAKIAENAILAAKNTVLAQISAVEARFNVISQKADKILAKSSEAESREGYSEAWARTSAQWAEHMPDTLPESALVSMDVSGDHWSSKWWANRADNAFGRLTDLYLGAHPEPPVTNLEGGPIEVGAIYYDTDPAPGQMMVWTGSQWASMTQPQRAGLMTLWYEAANGQTVFALNASDLNGLNYTLDPDLPEGVDAHLNGIKLMAKDSSSQGDWTLDIVTSTVTFLRPLRAGDIVSFDILMPVESLAPGNVFAWSLVPMTGNGSTKVFLLDTKDAAGPPVTIAKYEELLLWVNDVIQEPGVDFTVLGATLTFVTAPPAASHVFATWYRPGPSGGGGGPSGPVDWNDVVNKPASYPPTVPISWADISSKPATYAPTLPIASSGVTGLDAKQLAQDNATAAKLSDAASDGKQYVRKDGAWVVIDTPFSVEAITGDVILKIGGVTVVRIKPSGLILTKDDIEVFSVSV